MTENLAKSLSLLGGLLQLAVGLTHLIKTEFIDDAADWCVKSHDRRCVGRYLSWNRGGNVDFADDCNAKWRTVFSLTPAVLAQVWMPTVFGILTLLAHLERRGAYMDTFVRLCAWHLFLGVFCCFPYAGSIGIVVGFVQILVSAVALFIRLTKGDGGVATHDFTPPRLLSSSASGGFISVSRETVARLVNVGSLLVLFANLFVLLVGMTHLFENELRRFCHSSSAASVACVGPWLIFPTDTDEFARSVNLKTFGHVFTLEPNRFVEIWAPAAVALLSLAYPPRRWLDACGRMVLMALFVEFGYAGNAGVVCGFYSVFVAVYSLLVFLCGGDDEDGSGPSGGASSTSSTSSSLYSGLLGSSRR